MSEYLRLLEHEIHIAALSFMGAAYVMRILSLFKFKLGIERSLPAKYHSHAVAASLLAVAKPWTIEKNRMTPLFYVQFAIFHLGAAAAISMTFIIPYWPEILKIDSVVWLLQIILAAAFIVGLSRLYRRTFDPALRLISTPDDYFALVMMIVFYAVGVSAVPNRYDASDWALVAFFLMAAFFHLYVPFSKIIHYLYYPFTRYYLGKTMVHRGIGNDGYRGEALRRNTT
jgi:nitrate reductase gamma subunit